MKRTIALGAVSAALGLAILSAPNAASASCSDRKATGTIVGGIGGALIGNSIAGGGGGALLGGLGGAVAGHAIAGSGCGRYRHADYERGRSYGYGRRENYRGETYRPAAQTVYYDARGNPLPAYGGGSYAQSGYSQAAYRPERCVADQSYYDARGNLVQQPATCR